MCAGFVLVAVLSLSCWCSFTSAFHGLHGLGMRLQARSVHATRLKISVNPDSRAGSSQESDGNNSNSNENLAPKIVPPFVELANSWSVDLIKGVLVRFFDTRNYAKFYALETIARVPYFAYVSVLHLKESCGYRQNKDLVKLHFSEVLSIEH